MSTIEKVGSSIPLHVKASEVQVSPNTPVFASEASR